MIALWTAINHRLFRICNNKKVTGPKNKNEMAKAWSEINKKYAFDMAKRETHEDTRTLMKGYKVFFAHPLFNLFKLVKTFY